MTLVPREMAAPHSQNTTYVSEYTRGLLGVNVPFDILLTQIVCGSLGFACVIIMFARFSQMGHSYLRRVTSAVAGQKQQRVWEDESPLWTKVKKHILYAPLGRKRHNREIMFSSAINVGTVPSRFHATLLGLYLISQVAYCSILDYSVNEKAALVAELRGRSGNLAVLNMIPLILLAGRNNPLIPLLHVSFDTYNLIHRWLGRIVVLESITHTIAWTINAVDAAGWDRTWSDLISDPFFTWGFVATVCMVLLGLHTPSPIRHAFYETFLHLHQLLAFLAVLGVYLHIDIDKLPQKPWLQFMVCMWALERGARFARLVYLNVSRRHGVTKVIVKALPGEASRVTFFLPRKTRIPPGSHVYAYLPRISLWMSHPFSVAWAEEGSGSLSKLSSSHSSSTSSGQSFPDDTGLKERNLVTPSSIEIEKQGFEDEFSSDRFQPTCVSLVMGARTGMTRKLYNAALASPNSTLHTTGFIEGPYRSHPTSFGSYGTVVLFSGGAGITHHMLHVRELLQDAEAGRIATRKIYLIWSVRTTEHLTWVRGFMDSILHMPNRRELLVTKLFVSKPKSGREISSPSSTLQMFPGRCRPNVVLEEALAGRVGATAVSVCGPGAFADEVRAAARERMDDGLALDFVEEAFTW